jgi:hypothetical protein
MIDGQLRRVAMFPEDGHPDFNESNYRTTVSLPLWVNVK